MELLISLAILFCTFRYSELQHRGCIPKEYDSFDISCVCNATYCDNFPPLGQLDLKKAVMYVSSKRGQRFERSEISFRDTLSKRKFYRKKQRYFRNIIDAIIDINTTTRYQTILGYGGAFTDAVGINLNRLSSNARLNLLKSYYDADGIEYTIGRVPIGSTDFSTHTYSYCDSKDDFDLKNFYLAKEDFELKIPYIKTALSMSNLSLFASPWSPPAWMKETEKMSGGGQLKGTFNGQYYTSWANYITRFFEEYLKEGVIFWGLTLQNEPSAGAFKNFPWQALYLSADMQRDFIAQIFGPHLRSVNATRNLKLMIHDDQRYFLPYHADVILQDKNAAKYIDGIGVHWYGDFFAGPGRLTETHLVNPDKFILPTEACSGFVPYFQGPVFGSWRRGEDYAQSIIEDHENWAIGWTDWNICLDEQGGPNFAENFVDSPIIVNSTIDEFYKQPMYYALGHFSKFIRPGSKRIGLELKNLGLFQKSQLYASAFINPDNQIVLVILNRYSKYTFTTFISSNDAKFTIVIQPNSINTIIWKHS